MFFATLCFKVGHEDEDEKYDKSSFVVARFFRGNFTLDGNSFTSNSQDEDAIKKLEQKVITRMI